MVAEVGPRGARAGKSTRWGTRFALMGRRGRSLSIPVAANSAVDSAGSGHHRSMPQRADRQGGRHEWTRQVTRG